MIKIPRSQCFISPQKASFPWDFLSKQVPIVEALEGCQEGPAVVELCPMLGVGYQGSWQPDPPNATRPKKEDLIKGLLTIGSLSKALHPYFFEGGWPLGGSP